ncbi:MAG: hypothetical protein ACRCUQ_04075 [Alphaproteobacteria bacterium]
MQISKKILQTGAPLALFLAVSVATVSSAQAGADFGIEEDSNAAPVEPAKPKPTSEQFQAAKALKGFKHSNWELYFSDFLEAKKAGIELKTSDDLSAYEETKTWLKAVPTPEQFQAGLFIRTYFNHCQSQSQIAYFKDMLEAQKAGIKLNTWGDLFTYQQTKAWSGDQAPTLKQFQAGLIIKEYFNNFQTHSQIAYFKDALEAQEAGIEIQGSSDLFMYQEIRPLLEGVKPTLEQFQAAKDLKGFFEEIEFSPSKYDFLDVFEAQKASIQLKTWDDLSTYQEIKPLLKREKPTPEQFQAAKTLKESLKEIKASPSKQNFLAVFEAQKAGIQLKTWDDLSTYGHVELWLRKAPALEQFQAGITIRKLFKVSDYSSQIKYFKDVLEAQEAGIEIKDPNDLHTYRGIKSLLEKQNTLDATLEKPEGE